MYLFLVFGTISVITTQSWEKRIDQNNKCRFQSFSWIIYNQRKWNFDDFLEFCSWVMHNLESSKLVYHIIFGFFCLFMKYSSFVTCLINFQITVFFSGFLLLLLNSNFLFYISFSWVSFLFFQTIFDYCRFCDCFLSLFDLTLSIYYLHT